MISGSFLTEVLLLHAYAVDNLRAAEARVIVFDLLLIEESEEDKTLAAAISGGNVVLATMGLDPLDKQADMLTFGTVLAPAVALEQASPYVAHALFPEDADSVVRRVPLAIRDASGAQYPALAVAAMSLQLGRPA